MGGGNGEPLGHGTRISLSSLRKRRALDDNQFRRSLARRFALDDMRIYMNGSEITRFNLETDIRFPLDGTLFGEEARVCGDGWAEMFMPGGGPVRWWVGFQRHPIREKQMQGVSVLARGKLVQRPFFFERTAGAEGQLGQEYLVGEVKADWLDDGNDIDTDLVQANRDQLQLEDDRLTDFIDWGQTLIRRSLKEWAALRQKQVAERMKPESFETILQRVSPVERQRLKRVVFAISHIPAIDIERATELVESIVDAHSDAVIRDMLVKIDSHSFESQVKIWELVRQFGLIDARRNQSIIEARLRTIAKLRTFVDEGAREVPTLHNHIKQHPWLLDPRCYLLDDEVRLSDLDIHPDQSEPGMRLDYLFALGPSSPYTHDELLVVEIKRSADKHTRPVTISNEEVSRFQDYGLAAQDSSWATTSVDGSRLRVTAVMIGSGQYTKAADRKRKSLQRDQEVRFVFTTWESVLRETERLHKGWLAVTKRRANREHGTGLEA